MVHLFLKAAIDKIDPAVVNRDVVDRESERFAGGVVRALFILFRDQVTEVEGLCC